MSVRRTGVALAVAVALGAGLLAGLVPGHRSETEPIGFDQRNLAAAAAVEPGDRVQAAIDGVGRTGFYVGPELRGQLTPDEVAEIEQIIAGADVPLFVVWWSDTSDAGYSTEYAAIDQLRVGVGEEGYYAVVTQGSPPLTEALGYETPYVDADAKGRPAAALTRFVSALAAVAPERERPPGHDDAWGGAGGGIAAGLLFAGLGYLGLVIVVSLAGITVRTARGGRR